MRILLLFILILASSSAGHSQVQMFFAQKEAAVASYSQRLQDMRQQASDRGITEPSSADLAVMDSVISYLEAQSLWDSIDYFTLYIHDASKDWNLINWSDTTYFASEVGSPTWSSTLGYTSMDATNYIDSGWSEADGPSISSAKAAVGVYINAINFTNNPLLVGQRDGANNGTYLGFQAAGSRFRAGALSSAFQVFGVANQGEGFYSFTRSGINVSADFDGVTNLGTGTAGSVTASSNHVYIGTQNVAGTADGGIQSINVRGVVIGGFSKESCDEIATILDYYFSNI